ncbi:uncharacterized protein TrAtP1_009849 [Trichoderma atroviride]|uniref:uncharacterized protein n=1 Tax=Hypocrea atroviridis TaxID=63577 RepID=UPI0033324E19|nr:hypothetical protein TrAtP1_009849 [Trichoderma atroviride]
MFPIGYRLTKPDGRLVAVRIGIWGLGQGYPSIFCKIIGNVAVHTQRVLALERNRAYWALQQKINLKLASDLVSSKICELKNLFGSKIFFVFRLGMGQELRFRLKDPYF